ncbi:hypothetical protein [Streptococcus thoraltensis]|uniref:hypothetical protein n=1 Tax=Streptococcus thoraltensis TaxID=55085 RepID=UPI001F59DA1A|nr:hypothetical protein [Streptococcus thoraltensis]
MKQENNLNLINLTGHDIVIYDWETNEKVMTIPKTDDILRAQKHVNRLNPS